MKRIGSLRLPLSMTASFLAVGIPYWLIPYNKASLPGSLLTPGLAVVVLFAMLLRMHAAASFWRATSMIGLSACTAVMARVLVDVARDPTSHNLWPFEVVIALLVGLPCAAAGAVVGGLIARCLPDRSGEGKS